MASRVNPVLITASMLSHRLRSNFELLIPLLRFEVSNFNEMCDYCVSELEIEQEKARINDEQIAQDLNRKLI